MMQTAGQEKPISSPARSEPASLADMLQDQPSQPQALARETFAKILILAGLFIWLHWWQIKRLVSIPDGDWCSANWQHGWLIPLFSLYLMFVRRHELFDAKGNGNTLGLGLMIVAALIELWGVCYGVGFVQNVGMIAMLFGMVLFVGGAEIVRVTWLPIAFLMFAMPWPAMVYNQVAFTLQNVAAKLAGLLLPGATNIEGSSTLLVKGIFSGQIHNLTVAEACSGIRSLVAYLALGVAYTYIQERPLWQRLTLVILIVPVAIATNVLRVILTALMFKLDQGALGEGFMHEMMGMVMLVPALGIMWLISKVLGWIDRHLFIDEEEPTAPAKEGA